MLPWFIIGFFTIINTGTVKCKILLFTYSQHDNYITYLPINISQTSLYLLLSSFTVIQIYSCGLLSLKWFWGKLFIWKFTAKSKAFGSNINLSCQIYWKLHTVGICWIIIFSYNCDIDITCFYWRKHFNENILYELTPQSYHLETINLIRNSIMGNTNELLKSSVWKQLIIPFL